MAADFLDRIKSKNKIRVGFDVLEIESKLLVESSQGQFIVVVNGSRKTRSILLPKRTRFEGSDDRQLYSNCYDSEKTDDGDVRILSPAVVKKTREGWVLVERGRIEVVRPGSEISESPPAVPRRAADYLKQGTESTIVNFDPGKNLLVLDPDRKGSLTIVKSQSGENLLLPRVTEFLGTQGFQRYFSTYYQRFYDCPSLVAGDLWIVWPALVEKVKGGWRLTKKGALEIREEPAQREIKSEIQDDDQAPLSMKDHAHETSELTSTGDTSSSKPKYFLAALLAMSLVTIAVLAWRRYLTTNSVATSELRLRIEGGTFLMGSNDGAENERPQHSVTIKPFSIDTYEVTREEYEKFMQALNHKAPSGWINGKYPLNTARLPVTGIDWYDADAYCKWTGKRLPTEEEWELAARGFDGRKYPWGNDWKSGYANAENASTGLTDVDKFKGASPYGAIGMIGNAWEWTSSKLAPYPGGRLPPDELGNGQADLRVIRGGSWQSKRTSATTTYRWGWPASGGSDYANTGFRCVKDP